MRNKESTNGPVDLQDEIEKLTEQERAAEKAVVEATTEACASLAGRKRTLIGKLHALNQIQVEVQEIESPLERMRYTLEVLLEMKSKFEARLAAAVRTESLVPAFLHQLKSAFPGECEAAEASAILTQEINKIAAKAEDARARVAEFKRSNGIA